MGGSRVHTNGMTWRGWTAPLFPPLAYLLQLCYCQRCRRRAAFIQPHASARPTPTPSAQWGTPGAFPQLSVLSLDSNRINGSLPWIWGSPRAMSVLQEL